MHFTESKKRTPWIIVFVILVIAGIGTLTLCHFDPTPKTVQKTIVFEAD